MSLRPRHPTERVSETRRNRKNQDHFEEVRKGSWVLERVRAVGIKESTPVCTEFLDYLLRRHWALRDHLLRYRLGRSLAIGACDLSRVRLNEIEGRVRLQVLNYT